MATYYFGGVSPKVTVVISGTKYIWTPIIQCFSKTNNIGIQRFLKTLMAPPLEGNINVICTFILGWRVFPSVARYSESATSGQRVKVEGKKEKRKWPTRYGTRGAVFDGAQKHLWTLQCFVQAVRHLNINRLVLIIYYRELMNRGKGMSPSMTWKMCVFTLQWASAKEVKCLASSSVSSGSISSQRTAKPLQPNCWSCLKRRASVLLL